MKRFIYIFLSVLFVVVPSVAAINASSSATPQPTSVVESEIQTLKDKIATKVAQLRSQNNKAISGYVVDITDTINVKTDNQTVYTVKIDDSLTQFFQISAATTKTIKFSDVKKGDFVIVDGVINDKDMSANAVYEDTQYLTKVGTISQVNKDDFSLTAVTNDKDTFTLDIENSTQQYLLNIKTQVAEKSGFSKIKEGDTIHFVVRVDAKADTKNNRYPAQKILIIPQEYFMK